MAVRIAQASRGESGYYYQQAGNQTGQELNIRSWYSRPWDVVLRAKEPAVASRIAEFMESAVANLKIGYDMGGRMSLYHALQRAGMDPAKVTTPVECDCSSLVSAAVNAAGVMVPTSMVTSTIETNLIASKQFYALREDIYTRMDGYLHRGDILLNTVHHVAVALDAGSKITQPKAVSYAVTVNVSPNTYLTVRTSPEVRDDNLFRVYGEAQRKVRGEICAILEERDGWGRIGDIQAWINLSYCRKAGD